MEICRHQEHSLTNKGTDNQVLRGNVVQWTLVTKNLNSRSELKWRKEGNNFPARQGPRSCTFKLQQFFCGDFIVDTINIGSSREWQNHYHWNKRSARGSWAFWNVLARAPFLFITVSYRLTLYDLAWCLIYSYCKENTKHLDPTIYFSVRHLEVLEK